MAARPTVRCLSLLLIILGIVAKHAEARPSAGKYAGYLRSSKADESFQITLDLIEYGSRNQSMQAVVKVLQGGFRSFEYISTYYKIVAWSDVDKSLSFLGAEGALQIKGVKLFNSYLRGKLTTLGSSFGGEFFLKRLPEDSVDFAHQDMLLDTAYPTLLTGTYRAEQCSTKDEMIELEMMRSSSPYSQLALSGRLVRKNAPGCEGTDSYCVIAALKRPKVNFLDKTYTFFMEGKQSQCLLSSKGLNCDGCKYTKEDDTWQQSLAKFKKYHKVFRLPESLDQPPNRITPGRFLGYLHHEQLGSYQALQITIDEQNKYTWKAVSSLSFGPYQNQQFIAYRNKAAKVFDDGDSLLFSGKGENLFLLDGWVKGVIQGKWYSKAYGYVGRFELVREKLYQLPKTEKLMPTPYGRFKGKEWIVAFNSSPGVSEASWDYFPLNVYGSAQLVHVRSRPLFFKTIKFDFYSGLFAFSVAKNLSFWGLMRPSGIIDFLRSPAPRKSRHRPFKNLKVYPDSYWQQGHLSLQKVKGQKASLR